MQVVLTPFINDGFSSRSDTNLRYTSNGSTNQMKGESRHQLIIKIDNLPEARENKSFQVGIGFGLAFDWLRRWREFF